MLTPEQLNNLPEQLINLYSTVESDILASMAERISKYEFIPAAQWQYQKLIDMGLTQNDIIERLSEVSGIRKQQLKKMMKNAGAETLKTDSKIYKRAGLDPDIAVASEGMKEILQAGLESTNGLFENLTHTTARTGSKQFENALDRAWLQVQTGAFDYNSAVRMAVKDLAVKGLESISYPSGRVDTLETAVRRAVVTGINQTALKQQDKFAEDLGSDLVETTAHAGARPSHALWQGRVFSRSGTSLKYPPFKDSTGYGTGAGLGGYNCRHSFFPFFEGTEQVYTEQELSDLNAKKYEYNGQKMTEYEAEQKQRQIERNIRRWKREYSAMDAAGQPTEEAASKVIRWQQEQDDFIKQTGLKRQYDWENFAGFGREEAKKSKITNQKYLKNPQDFATLKAVSGGRITNIYSKAASAHAERYYDFVRKMKTDVSYIAQNTGFSETEVQAIKNYLFMEKHDLGGFEPQLFSPDFAIAQSWQRLIKGNLVSHDLTLLRHEIMEKKLIGNGLSQESAHIEASKAHNYSKEVADYYATLKKHKN